MDNVFIKQIRCKIARCIFFDIIRMQNMNFLSKLNLNGITKIWKIENNSKLFFIKNNHVIREKPSTNVTKKVEFIGHYTDRFPYIKMN